MGHAAKIACSIDVALLRGVEIVRARTGETRSAFIRRALVALTAEVARAGAVRRSRWARIYVRGLIAPGERKSVEPMARRQCPGEKEELHHFVATSTWDTREHERLLLDKADALLGGNDAHLIVDDTALVKKTHSVGVAHQYCGQLGKDANCRALVSTRASAPTATIPTRSARRASRSRKSSARRAPGPIRRRRGRRSRTSRRSPPRSRGARTASRVPSSSRG